MIVDSPYTSGEALLAAWEAALAGLLSTAWMLMVLRVLAPLGGLEYPVLPMQLALVVFPGCRHACGAPFLFWTGLGVCGVLGAICGLLYGSSQMRIPARGLIAVGLFYGLVLWVVGGLLAGPIGGTELRATIRSWPWLGASLTYGIWLSAMAALAGAKRRSSVRVALPD